MDRIDRILAGFDFSPCSTLSLQYAIEVAWATGAELDILFVEVLHGEALNTTSRERLDQLVDQQLMLRGRPGLRVHRSVERYFAAAPAIVDHAERTGARLIVMGTHGRRGLRALMLGSVAQEVVRSASIPVLTVRCKTMREPTMDGVDHILVPFDFSTHSRRALRKAAGIAAVFGSRLTVLHVIEDRFHPAFYGPFFQSIFDLDPHIKDKALAHLNEEIEAVKDLDLDVETVAVQGYPGTVISSYANEHEVNLIVMSTHGLSGLELLSFGSVAQRTLASANCPVLTLRSQAEEDRKGSQSAVLELETEES
jgi:nucleotide-binding universal stress UspA family protein